MTRDQIAILLLTNPDFAKQAGFGQWLKGRAAPAALAAAMAGSTLGAGATGLAAINHATKPNHSLGGFAVTSTANAFNQANEGLSRAESNSYAKPVVSAVRPFADRAMNAMYDFTLEQGYPALNKLTGEPNSEQWRKTVESRKAAP